VQEAWKSRNRRPLLSKTRIKDMNSSGVLNAWVEAKVYTIDTCHGLAGVKDECKQPTTRTSKKKTQSRDIEKWGGYSSLQVSTELVKKQKIRVPCQSSSIRPHQKQKKRLNQKKDPTTRLIDRAETQATYRPQSRRACSKSASVPTIPKTAKPEKAKCPIQTPPIFVCISHAAKLQ
jgi:hypothetical protein